jgi:hypothetical protein
MSSKRYKCRSVRRTAPVKKNAGVQGRTNLAPKESPVKVMSDAKAKALLEARLKAEIAEKKNKQAAMASSPRSKSVVSAKPAEPTPKAEPKQPFVRPEINDTVEKPVSHAETKAAEELERPEIAPEPEVVPDLDEASMGTESVREIYHRIQHITVQQLLYQARQSAKAYDKSYLELQSQQQALDAKLGEIKAAKTPSGADDALKAQYNEKRKALRAERDAIQKQLTIATQTTVPLERVCDELEAVATWKLDKPTAFRKQPRLNDIDPNLDDNISELKALVNAKAGYYTTERTAIDGMARPESAPEPKVTGSSVHMDKTPEPAGQARVSDKKGAAKTLKAPTAKKETMAEGKKVPMDDEQKKPAEVTQKPAVAKQEAPAASATGGGGTGDGKKSGKFPKWLIWVIVAVVVLIIIILASCSKKQVPTVAEQPVVVTSPAKTEEAKPAPAPAKVETPAPAPAPAKAEAPAPAPAKAETPAPAPVEAPKPYGEDVAVATASDGSTTYTAQNGLTVVVAKDGSMKTSFAGVPLTDETIVSFSKAADGSRVLTYQDGTVVSVDKAGYATIALGNGLSVAFTAKGTNTLYGGQVVSTADIISFSSSKDGAKRIGYADGSSVAVDAKGFATVDVGNGMTVAFTQDGMVTSYLGQPVSKAAIVSYETLSDGSRKVAYADGSSVVVDPKGFATVSLGNGVSVAFTASGMTTSYEGLPITNAGITLYAVKKDGSRTIGYADGTSVAIDANGFGTVDLGNGMTVAFTKQGEVTSFLGQPLTTAAIAGYQLGSDGSRTVSYADGTSVVVDAKGFATVNLKNGVSVAFTKSGTVTTEGGKTVTTAPISAYAASSNGVRKVGFADGTVLSVDASGTATVTAPAPKPAPAPAPVKAQAPAVSYGDDVKVTTASDGTTTYTAANGITVAVAKNGSMKTSFAGFVVTDQPILGFKSGADGTRVLTYKDGTVVSVDKAGYATIALPNGVKVAFTKTGTLTTYGSVVVSDQPITKFSASNGTKSVTYADGMVASVDQAGFGNVELPNGMAVAFTKDGMATSFAGQVVSTVAITGYAADASGAKHLAYENGMKVDVAATGVTTVSLPNSLKVQINALDDMQTSIAGVVVNDTPVQQFAGEADGSLALLYGDQSVLIVMPEGNLAYALPNGLVFATDGSWVGTFYGNTAISESAIVGYAKASDGSQKVTYADGVVLTVQKSGWVNIASPNGITIATSPDGWETSYRGIVVTKAAVNGFQTQGDERLLSFDDGMMVYTKGDSIVDVMFASGAEIAADENGVHTRYQGLDVSSSAITGFSLAADGSKTIAYADGMKAVIAKDGSVARLTLADGLEYGPQGFVADGQVITAAATGYSEENGVRKISFSDGTLVTAGPEGVNVTKPVAVAAAPKAEEPKPVAEAPKAEAPVAAPVVVAEAPKAEAPATTSNFVIGLGGYGVYGSEGFPQIGVGLRLGYKLSSGLYFGLDTGYGFGLNGNANSIPLAATVGYAGKYLYGGLLVGAEFVPEGTNSVLFSLGGYAGVKYDFTDNLGVFAEAGVKLGFAGSSLAQTRGTVSVGLTYQF